MLICFGTAVNGECLVTFACFSLCLHHFCLVFFLLTSLWKNILCAGARCLFLFWLAPVVYHDSNTSWPWHAYFSVLACLCESKKAKALNCCCFFSSSHLNVACWSVSSLKGQTQFIQLKLKFVV